MRVVQAVLGPLMASFASALVGCSPDVSEAAGSGGASSSSSTSSTSSSASSTISIGGASSSSSSSSSSSTGGGHVRCDPTSTDAVAFQINPQHTGAQVDPTLALPLTKRWSVDLGGAVSYPLIAAERVFVTVASADPHGGSILLALDLSTGAVLWSPPPFTTIFPWSNAAYEGGRVFVVDANAHVAAFDASTGTLNWMVQLPFNAEYSAPPVAFGGVVYVGTPDHFYALDEASGDQRWLSYAAPGVANPPAVSEAGVVVAYHSGVAGLAPSDGTSTWDYPQYDQGTPVICGGEVFARDYGGVGHNQKLDLATGTPIAPFPADTLAAFSGTRGFFLDGGRLHARDIETLDEAWSFGDDTLVSGPIVVGSNVFVASANGTVFAVDADSGAELWSDNAGAPIAASGEENLKQRPLTGLAEASGVLVVPAGSKLVAYAP